MLWFYIDLSVQFERLEGYGSPFIKDESILVFIGQGNE